MPIIVCAIFWRLVYPHLLAWWVEKVSRSQIIMFQTSITSSMQDIHFKISYSAIWDQNLLCWMLSWGVSYQPKSAMIYDGGPYILIWSSSPPPSKYELLICDVIIACRKLIRKSTLKYTPRSQRTSTKNQSSQEVHINYYKTAVIDKLIENLKRLYMRNPDTDGNLSVMNINKLHVIIIHHMVVEPTVRSIFHHFTSYHIYLTLPWSLIRCLLMYQPYSNLVAYSFLTDLAMLPTTWTIVFFF